MADTDSKTTAAPKGAVATRAKPQTISVRGTVMTDGSELAEAEREALRLANIAAAGTDSISGSGAILEPDAASKVDVDHPAVDNNPRAGTSVSQNQIDFNDPSLQDAEAVMDNLSKQD